MKHPAENHHSSDEKEEMIRELGVTTPLSYQKNQPGSCQSKIKNQTVETQL